jgi:hypothetical protein
VPWSLKRFHESGQTPFATFCCDRRRYLFMTANSKRTFETALERVRRGFGLSVYGYVVMPEHVHLLVSEAQRGPLTNALRSSKTRLEWATRPDGMLIRAPILAPKYLQFPWPLSMAFFLLSCLNIFLRTYDWYARGDYIRQNRRMAGIALAAFGIYIIHVIVSG